MSEQSEKNIRQALYVAVANKLQGELSELEAKEILENSGVLPAVQWLMDQEQPAQFITLKVEALDGYFVARSEQF
mgnify:CR=1 FL=1